MQTFNAPRAVDTLFMMTVERYFYVSSRMVKEIAMLGGAAGTFASLGAQGPAVQAGLAGLLGLAPTPVPSRTHRDREAEYVTILGLIADAAGLFGGALMSWVELGISPAMFATRLVEGTNVSNVFVGLVKAPVFAILIVPLLISLTACGPGVSPLESVLDFGDVYLRGTYEESTPLRNTTLSEQQVTAAAFDDGGVGLLGVGLEVLLGLVAGRRIESLPLRRLIYLRYIFSLCYK